MELDQLKSAWNKVSEQSEKQSVLAEKDIQNMLSKRTKDIYQRIGRNIRVGIVIILAWIGMEILTNFFFSNIFEDLLDKPYMTEQLITWSYILNIFNYVLILSTITVFWIRYKKLEKEAGSYSSLAFKIDRLINIIKSYKRMFYMILVIVILLISVSFSTGFFMEFRYQAMQGDFTLGDFSIIHQIAIVVSFLLVLGIFITIYLILFRLFFKRLYGRYLNQLEATKTELLEE